MIEIMNAVFGDSIIYSYHCAPFSTKTLKATFPTSNKQAIFLVMNYTGRHWSDSAK